VDTVPSGRLIKSQVAGCFTASTTGSTFDATKDVCVDDEGNTFDFTNPNSDGSGNSIFNQFGDEENGDGDNTWLYLGIGLLGFSLLGSLF